MKFAAWLFLAACGFHADAATITVTITGTTGQIKVGEGPIFGHSSYQSIPPGVPFSLTYLFEDAKGKQGVTATDAGLITQSHIENVEDSSPGTNAVLQIGSAVWEFGASSRSHVVLTTAPGGSRGEDFLYQTRGGANRVSAQITPAKGGYWPRNGDWRASFTATDLDGSAVQFSADNDRVSAAGKLIPTAITVSGVDVDGQWLRATADHTWQLAHPSARGGYVIAEVNTVVRGTRADGSPIMPASMRYWQAWRVPPGATTPAGEASFATADMPDAMGEEKVTVVARFYEALVLPSSFHNLLRSTNDPELATSNSTLPAEFSFTRGLGDKR